MLSLIAEASRLGYQAGCLTYFQAVKGLFSGEKGHMFKELKKRIEGILSLGSQNMERPQIKKNNESNIPGVYIIGDLVGAPVIKLAMEQGYNVKGVSP